MERERERRGRGGCLMEVVEEERDADIMEVIEE